MDARAGVSEADHASPWMAAVISNETIKSPALPGFLFALRERRQLLAILRLRHFGPSSGQTGSIPPKEEIPRIDHPEIANRSW
jgi:hypothetical protein